MTGAKRRDAFVKLLGGLRNTLADFVGAIYIDKFSLLAASDAVCEPAMDPLSSGNCPGIAVIIARHNIEKEFHPNDGRRPQCLFPLRDAQRFFLLERSSKRKFVFARRAQLPPRIECIPRPTDANRINFLRIYGRPILQPIAGLLFQCVECLLRNATTICVEVQPGEKFVRVRYSIRCCFGIQTRACADGCGDRFDQVEELAATDLSLFIGAE